MKVNGQYVSDDTTAVLAMSSLADESMVNAALSRICGYASETGEPMHAAGESIEWGLSDFGGPRLETAVVMAACYADTVTVDNLKRELYRLESSGVTDIREWIAEWGN